MAEPLQAREDLLALAEAVAEEDGGVALRQRGRTEGPDLLLHPLRLRKAVARLPERGLHDHHIRFRHFDRLGAAAAAELEVAGVEEPGIVPLDQHLCGT